MAIASGFQVPQNPFQMPFPARVHPVANHTSAFTPEIQAALDVLGRIQHLPADEAYMREMGIDVIFRHGSEALNLIQNKSIRVEFGDMGDSPAHAQWIQEQNMIMINQKYRGNFAPAVINAIAEAIYHEAGHAARHGDNQASIQEELNCLALNTLAHRYHRTTSPADYLGNSNSNLINDGVALYSKLFFDPDPYKKALINRVIQKYGQLPLETPDHQTPMLNNNIALGYRVLRQAQSNQTSGWVA